MERDCHVVQHYSLCRSNPGLFNGQIKRKKSWLNRSFKFCNAWNYYCGYTIIIISKKIARCVNTGRFSNTQVPSRGLAMSHIENNPLSHELKSGLFFLIGERNRQHQSCKSYCKHQCFVYAHIYSRPNVLDFLYRENRDRKKKSDRKDDRNGFEWQIQRCQRQCCK